MSAHYNVGFTFGVFDILHLEHVDHLKLAREACDFLFVGVLTDEAAEELNGGRPVNTYDERLQIVRSLRQADAAIGQPTTDLLAMWRQLQFETLVLTGDPVEVDPELSSAVDVVHLGHLRGTTGGLSRPRMARGPSTPAEERDQT